MTAFESSYKSLLQGVSQQIPRERLPGQVGAQENMLSDPVTNLRRRPGAEYKFNLSSAGATYSNIKAWFTDIAGVKVHVIVNCSSGTVHILDSAYAVLATLAGGAYLTTSDPSHIRAATLGDELFLLNTAVKPTEVAASGGIDPVKRGYFYIAAGAFSREYSVTVSTSTGTYTASYTTPTGSSAGDAALSTPTYIATQLANAINTNKATPGLATVDRVTAYVYVEAAVGTTAVNVNSSTGSAYIQVSKDGYTTQTGNLPAQLPANADGYIMRVGDVRTPQYYKYVHAQTSWLEAGSFDSPASISNVPISITKNGTWQIVSTNFEGRLAGDDESNPDPKFLTNGITGIGVYQGRLALLSGAYVRMSASNKPRRMYRSTITSLLDSDPIEVSSGANSSASYEYAIPFQKDLVLFSADYQALIPSGNAAVTPRTATVVLTSTHAADMTCEPITLGRTLMYAAPLSADFFGMLEMVPSQYTDSQYISNPSTSHLPKYMGGRCRFGVAAGYDGTVLLGPSGDTKALIVHEYTWDGDQKVQAAWHRWSFAYDVAAAYFANEQVHILFAQNNTLVGCVIDPRIGLLTADAQQRPFLDLHSSVTITDNLVDVPAWMLTFDPTIVPKLRLSKGSGPLAGSKVGFEQYDSNTLKTVRSHPSGSVSIGVPFESLFSPTPPVVRDKNDVAISTNKATLLRYIVGTQNSAEYNVVVQDRNTPDVVPLDVGTLYWSSSELALNRALVALTSNAIVPCRTNVDSTTMTVSTNETGELNLVSLEYVLRFNQKIRRF